MIKIKLIYHRKIKNQIDANEMYGLNWNMVQSIGTKYVVYQKKKKWYLSHISYVCLVSAVYNPNLQLQRLGPFVVVL